MNVELRKIPTCELVKELSMREGVERIDTSVEGKDIIVSVGNNSKELNDYIMMRSGPSIILRVID